MLAEEYSLKKITLTLDGCDYSLVIRENLSLPDSDVPVLCIASYLPTKKAATTIRIAVESIRKFTDTPYSLWIIDDNSPASNLRWLRQQTDLTLVENYTFLHKRGRYLKDGSYRNAVCLEICAKLMPNNTKYFMTLHSDTLVCKKGWLAFLLSKFTESVKAVGVREDKGRVPEGILHCLGCVFDFQTFKKLNLDFYPDLPAYDMGDKTTVEIRRAGYTYYVTKNTIWDTELAAGLSEPYSGFGFDRAIDDEGDVFFMHLGRGTLQATGKVARQKNKSWWEWCKYASKYLELNIGIIWI